MGLFLVSGFNLLNRIDKAQRGIVGYTWYK